MSIDTNHEMEIKMGNDRMDWAVAALFAVWAVIGGFAVYGVAVAMGWLTRGRAWTNK